MPRVIQVIESDELRGKGVEGSPVRRVRTYFTPEGEWLGEAHDSYRDAEKFAEDGWSVDSIPAACIQLDHWRARALRAEKRLDESAPLAAGLVDVVRWALGEIGVFVDPPDSLTKVIVKGRAALLKGGEGRHPTPLYWWRKELRRRATEAGANLGAASEGGTDG